MRAVGQLVRDTGGVPLAVGDLRHALYLEACAALVIAQLFGGLPTRTVFNLVDDSRGPAPSPRTDGDGVGRPK